MKVVVPLKSLVIDEGFILNNIQFIDTGSTEVYLDSLSIREDYEKNKNTLLPELVGFDFNWYNGNSLALVELTDVNESNIISNHEQMIDFAYSVTEKINRTLDFIRIMQCNVTEQEKIPSYPGICLEGFSSFLLINEKNEYIPFIYRMHNLNFVEGLGLYLEDVSKYSEDPLFKVLYSNESNYVSKIITQAIKRLNETMYIADPNTQFVYLMSTLEVICSSEYIGFSEVRQRIAAITCSNKISYNDMGDKLREFSEVYRTDIIHNGIDMFKNHFEERKHNLLFLQGLIVKCVYKLIESEVKSEEEFLEYIEMKKTQLDVQPNQKLNKEELIEGILKNYSSDEVITFNYDEWCEILNNSNKNFLKKILTENTITN